MSSSPPDLAGYASALRQLADDVASATRLPENWTNPESAYHSDLAALPLESPAWGDEAPSILRRAVWDCGKYVSVISRHAYGVAALIDAREVYVSIWPLLRSQLEAGGRLVWVLEPHTRELTGVGPRRRAARYFLDLCASVCYQYEALEGLRSKHQAEVRRLRDKAFAEVERLYGTSLAWDGAGSENGWQIEADKYVGLASGAEHFAKHLHPSLRGIYPSLSGYSHPSIRFIDELITESQTEDGHRVINWHFEIGGVDKQTHISAGILYRAATGLLSYVGGYQDLLESAMDRFEASVPTLTSDS